TRGATVTVTVDGRSVTAPTYSSGMWFAPPLHVGAGTQTITITSTLDGQSTSPVSVQREFTDPVQAPALVSPAAGSTTASGMVSFYGTSTPGASVTLTVGERTVTALTYSSGMWFAPPVQVAPGNQSIYMTASSVDFTSPTVRTVRYFESALEQPTLVSPAEGSTTASGMVSMYGTSTPGAIVTMTVGGQTVSALTYSSGMWFAPPVQVAPGNESIYMTADLEGLSSPTVRSVRYFR